MKLLIEREELASLIPHTGLMCLNDAVLEWDQSSIVCLSRSHLRKDNPLYKNNKLSVLHAIEYCAQAMAIHGGLLAREKGKTLENGYLAAVRNVELSHRRLDEIEEDLISSATQLMAQGGSMVYEFKMHYCKDDIKVNIASGRATVIQMK